jgi:hypothetical protein
MGREVVLSNDGKYVLTATNSSFDNGITIKLNEEGEVEWVAPYGGFGMASTYDGYIVARSINYEDGQLVMLDEDGDLQWINTYGSGNSQEDLSAVISTSDSCFVACGYSGLVPDSGIFVMKTNHGGNMLWRRNFFSDQSGMAFDVVELFPDYYVVGRHHDANYNYHLDLIKIDPDGNTLVHRSYPIGPSGRSISVTNDSMLVIAGGYKLIKCNLACDTIWTRSYSQENLYCAHAMADNGFYISGNQHIGNYAEVNLVAKTNPEGFIQWKKLFASGNAQMVAMFESIVTTPDNGFVTCGYSDYDTAYLIRAIRGDADGSIYVEINEGRGPNAECVIFPNPFSNILHIEGTGLDKIQIYNASGDFVGEFYKEEIDLSQQPPGLYLLKIFNHNSFILRKVVKK